MQQIYKKAQQLTAGQSSGQNWQHQARGQTGLKNGQGLQIAQVTSMAGQSWSNSNAVSKPAILARRGNEKLQTTETITLDGEGTVFVNTQEHPQEILGVEEEELGELILS